MMKTLFFCFMLLASIQSMGAQESRIGFSVQLSSLSEELSEANQNILKNKIEQIIARNSAGAVSASSVLFSIRPELIITQNDIVRTGMQDVYVYRAELTLYAVGQADENVFASVVIPLNGNGRSKNEAVRQMLNRLNISDVKITRFIRNAQEKIENFFIDNASAFILKADMLAKQRKYEEAVIVLSFIPETVAGYDAISERISRYYMQKIDMENEREINRAEALLLKDDVAGALDILAAVDPLSTYYDKAKKIMKKIKADKDAAMAAEAERLEREMELREREFDAQKRDEELLYAAKNSTQGTLTDSVGGVILDCFKDIAVGIITN